MHLLAIYVLLCCFDKNGFSGITDSSKVFEIEGWVQTYSDGKWTNSTLILPNWIVSIFVALLSSIDLLAVMPQVPNDFYPKIHNLLLGQGLFCDAMCVLLVLSCSKIALDIEAKDK